MLAAEKQSHQKIKKKEHVSVLDFTSSEPVCFAAERKIRTHLIWPSWGLMLVSCRKRVMKHPHHWLRRVTQELIMHIWGSFAADRFIISHELDDIISNHLLGSDGRHLIPQTLWAGPRSQVFSSYHTVEVLVPFRRFLSEQSIYPGVLPSGRDSSTVSL